MKISVDFSDLNDVETVMEQSERIANSNHTLEKRVADLKKLRTRYPNLADIPDAYIKEIKRAMRSKELL